MGVSVVVFGLLTNTIVTLATTYSRIQERAGKKEELQADQYYHISAIHTTHTFYKGYSISK